MDDAVAWTQAQVRDLEDRIANLTSTIRGLEEQRRELDEQVGHLRAWLTLYAATPHGEPASAGAVGSDAPADGDKVVRGSVADVCAAILRVDGPMATRQLTEKLIAIGKIKGDNQQTAYATVYSAMNRQPKRFKRVGRGHWALADELLTDPVGLSPNGPRPPVLLPPIAPRPTASPP